MKRHRVVSPQAPFLERLEVARRVIAAADAQRGQVPIHFADQLDATAAEAQHLNATLFQVVQTLQPSRGWHAMQSQASEESRTYLLAALLAAATRCPHISRSPQPVVVRLPLRRMDCTRCLGTLRKPPTADSDRCDVCEARGVQRFVPFAVTTGPTTILGDVCSACARVLGIEEKAA